MNETSVCDLGVPEAQFSEFRQCLQVDEPGISDFCCVSVIQFNNRLARTFRINRDAEPQLLDRRDGFCLRRRRLDLCRRLNRNRKNTLKWHLALVDDPCLLVVPGSQRRYRTDYERECLLNTRFEDIPSQEVIELTRGQTVFWDSNIIHRGRAPDQLKERLSIAAGLVKHQEADSPEELDGRFKWRLAHNIRDALPPKMRVYYDRWRALQLVEAS